VQLYKQAFQIMREKPAEEYDTVAVRLHAERTQLFVVTTAYAKDEVAAIIPGDVRSSVQYHRDIT